MGGELHYEFWSRLSFNYNLKSNWSIVSEFQLRQQRNYLTESGTSFTYPFARSTRIWINKKLKNGLTVHLSPIAYFKNYDFNKSDSISITDRDEIRVSAAVSKSVRYRKLEFKTRLMLENRQLMYPNLWIERGRIQEWINFQLKSYKRSSLNPYIMGEYFYRYSNRTFEFDQFRVQGGMIYKLKSADLILGLQWAHQSIEHKISDRIQSQVQVYINL